MTDKELKKLSRKELLELLIEQTRRADELEKKLLDAQNNLKSRDIDISNAGSIAEAALKLNGIFEAAEKAASQYVSSVKKTGVVPVKDEETKKESTESPTKNIETQISTKRHVIENTYEKTINQKVKRVKVREKPIALDELIVKLEKFQEQASDSSLNLK